MKLPAMKPCPFCGMTEEVSWVKLRIDRFTVWMECTNCESTGPEVSIFELAEEKAVKEWNKRK